MIKIPNENKWRVLNKGDLFGTLKYTQNLNFDSDGYLGVSPKSVAIRSNANSSDFGLPLRILYFNDGSPVYFIVTDQEIWEVGSDFTWTCISDAEASAVHPNIYSDAVIWQSRVYVSSDTTTDVRYWDGSAWTNPSIALSASSVPHPLAVMGNFSNGHLVVGENNTVKRYDTSHSLAATLTLNNNYQITGLLYRQNFLYVATKATDGGEAKLFVWNGSGTSAQNEYGCGADWIFAIEEYQSSVVVVTNSGELLRFNGGGFDQLATFPVYTSPYRWTVSSAKVHMRGMKADGDVLYINIDGAVGNRFTLNATTGLNSHLLPNQPSGVWCYDPKVGLYCRSAHTKDGYTSFTASALASNTLTLSASTNAVTGDPVHCQENGSLTGISDDTTYFIIKAASNQIKLAVTKADAIAGTAITLGGSVTSAVFYIINYNQQGEPYNFNADIGGLGLIQADSTDPPIFPEIFKSLYVWGFEDGSGNTYLCSQSVGSGVGFLTTVKVLSSSIRDSWQKLFTKFKDFYAATDKIIVRGLTKERLNVPTNLMAGTVSNSLTVGSSDSLLDMAEVGDTLVIVSGNGAGQRRKITAISGDELTFSEALIGVSASNAIVFYIEPYSQYQDADTTTSPTDLGYTETVLGETSTWIELQIELRGDIKIPELQLINSTNQ